MFDTSTLKEGDEVAFVEYKGNRPCKAKVIGFNEHPTRKIKLVVNYDYHAGNSDPDSNPGKWDERDVPVVTITGHWWEHEKIVNENRKKAREREERIEKISAKSRLLKKELEDRGIKYRYSLNEFSFTVDDLETLLEMRCFPRPA